MLVLPCLAGLGGSPAAPADGPEPDPDKPSLRAADRHFLSGEYDQARRLYEELADAPEHAVRAACGRSAVDLQVGDYRDGLERLRKVEAKGDDDAEWHVCVAVLLTAVGRYEEAVRHNRRAIELKEDSLRGRWQLGQNLERLGDRSAALRAYEIFEEVMTRPDLPGDAEGLTYLGLGFYRYSVLSGSANLVERTRHVLTEVYQEAFDFVDARYWPARLAAAELLLAKHNLQGARTDFEHILSQNPKAPDARVGLGRAALEEWDFEQSEKQAEAALEVNPNHVGALLLLAETRMTERRFPAAAEFAEKALRVNPNSIHALGVLAAARQGLGETKAAEQLLLRAGKINPRPAAFHQAMGRWLAAGRQFNPAEHHLKKAIEFAPWCPEPRTALGSLYMDTGEEAKARRELEASFELDSFNRRTHNVLDLLDSLDKFERLESDHFVVKFDAKEDAMIAPYFSETLEALYEDVCDDFDATLTHRTMIEVFPDHMGFSVRVTGRPFIGTVGACSGRVIALAAPRGRPPFGRFNWANVLRHEFTHTVTLAVTENRIPHWLTEGLAVYEESSPRSWSTRKRLSDRVRRDHLFTLESIDWGFMRPRRPEDRGVAYAQSEWMVEYIIERFRYRAILDLLKAFREGRRQDQAFSEVLKVAPDDFDRDFRAWAAKQVKHWGLPVTPVEDPKRIRERLAKEPDDTGLLARLAHAELLDARWEEAEAAARRALAMDENQTTALEVMAHVLIGRMLSEEDESSRRELIERAEPFVRRLHDLAPDNGAGIKYLGYVEQASGQWNEAIDLYEVYQRRFPEDPDSFRRLAGIYLRRKDERAALRQLESLFRLVDDEPAVARQIASVYAARGKPGRAAHWYRQALNIDPYDVDTHGALADAFLETGKLEKARREYQVVCRALPQEALGYDGLSRVYSAMGDNEQATVFLKKAEALRGGKPEGDPAELRGANH